MGLQLTDLHAVDVTAAVSQIPFRAEVNITAALSRKSFQDKGRAIRRQLVGTNR
jgi:hypothetical protein